MSAILGPPRTNYSGKNLKCPAVAFRRPRMRLRCRGLFCCLRTERERTGFPLAGHRRHGRSSQGLPVGCDMAALGKSTAETLAK
jgi:hypothetical protein